MLDFLSRLLDLPLGSFLLVIGIIFLFIAVAGKIAEKIDPGRAGRIVAGIIGTFLLIGGLVLTTQFPSITLRSIGGNQDSRNGPDNTPPSLRVFVRPADGPRDTHASGNATASCQKDEIMVGGGFTSYTPLLISQNYPSSKNTWTVAYSLFVFLSGIATPTSPRVLATAYAVCISSNSSIETDIQHTSSYIQQSHAAPTPTPLQEAQCEPGYTVLSGGYITPQRWWATESYPSSAFGWQVVGGGGGPSGDYQAYILCGKGAIVGQSTIIPNPFTFLGTTRTPVYSKCLSNQLATGGGFQVNPSTPFFKSNRPQQNNSLWAIDTLASSGTIYAVCVQFATT